MNKSTSLKNVLIAVIVICVISLSAFGIYKAYNYLTGFYIIGISLDETADFSKVRQEVVNISDGKITDGVFIKNNLYFIGYIEVGIPRWKNLQKKNIYTLISKLKQIPGVKYILYPVIEKPYLHKVQ